MKTTFLFALMQLRRVFRDPVTVIVLFAIPILLLVMFGAFTRTADNVSLRVAVINNSDQEFAKKFSDQVRKIDVFKQPDGKLTVAEAKQKMRDDQLDGIVELPTGFGALQNGMPSGKAKVYFDQTEVTTGDIVTSVMNSVVDQTNQQIIGIQPPLGIEKAPLAGSNVKIFDGLFAMFTAMAIMMVGIFGVASAVPYDKKAGVLRRLRVTPFKTSQFILGMTMTYLVIAVLAVALMTALAIGVFGLTMRGSWLDYGLFIILTTILMIGFGLMVGGWAKNTTQSDIYGQIIFIGSLAFSGLWFPRALMPDWLQSATAFLPLTPIIDGIRTIVTEGATVISLTSELLVIALWAVVVLLIGIKTFRWE